MGPIPLYLPVDTPVSVLSKQFGHDEITGGYTTVHKQVHSELSNKSDNILFVGLLSQLV